jgi:hypothetical protein
MTAPNRRAACARARRGLFAVALGAAMALVPHVAVADDAPTFADRSGPSVEGRDRSFALFVNPLAMAYGVFGGEADWVASSAIVASVDAAAVRTSAWAPGSTHRRGGVAVGGAITAFPWGGALHAFYVGARLGFVRSVDEPLLHVDRGVDVLELGIAAGWQWTWDYGLSVRVGAGPLIAVGGVPPAMSPEVLVGPVRFAAVADASIGWAF